MRAHQHPPLFLVKGLFSLFMPNPEKQYDEPDIRSTRTEWHRI